MNLREMRLLITLVVLVGGGGGSLLVYQMFVKPLADYNAQIKKLAAAVELKQEQLDTTLDERKALLEPARLKSLSPNPFLARAEYDKYLYPLLVESKLDIEDFRPTQPSVLKGTAAAPGSAAMNPTHQIIATKVRAKGDLEALVKALERIQKEPLVHRIKALTIDRDMAVKNATDKLTIDMTVEAMIVGKAVPHSDGPFAPDLRLLVLEAASALERAPIGIALLPWIVGPTGEVARKRMSSEGAYGRQYGEIPLKNIFIGRTPLPKGYNDDDPFGTGDAEKMDNDPLPVHEFVRLDMTDPDAREAYLRNLVFKTRPIKLRTASWSGYDTFKIQSEFGTRTLVKGKVIRITQRDVYFQVREDMYAIHLGQSVADAMRHKVTNSEMKALDLRIDEAWGAAEQNEYLKELAKARSGSSSNNKKKGGR
jgi:hypothetical protein